MRDIINAPEFHDCQRFVAKVADQLKYREFFAIWASSRLNSLVSDLVDVTPGRPVAIGLAPPLLGPDSVAGTPGVPGGQPVAGAPGAAPVADSPFAVAVAEIYAEGAYPPLGIEPWLNCLYLYRRDNRWEARMIAKGQVNVRCDRVGFTSPTDLPDGEDLEVVAASVAEFRSESDYPPVARWDWDSTNARQYIGIKCGAAWCEVGARGLRPSPALPVNVTDPRGIRRVRQIKGWYDQQFLADPDPARPDPTTILGTIIPDTLLGQLNAPGDFGRFTHAADVVLTKTTAAAGEALGRYAAKHGFVESTLASPNRMYLCQGAGCVARPGETAINCAPGQWQARIAAPVVGAAVSVLKCVTRRSANDYFVASPLNPGATPTIHVPGTARWRWKARDEGSWMRCNAGCCDTEF